MKEFIKKWEKIFKDNKYEMGSAFILYNMSCHEKYQELNEEQKEKILSFAYDFYLKDESCIDVGKITDTIMDNYEGILNGELDKTNIYCLIDY